MPSLWDLLDEATDGQSEPTLDGDAALRAPCRDDRNLRARSPAESSPRPVRLLISGFIRMLMKPALFTWGVTLRRIPMGLYSKPLTSKVPPFGVEGVRRNRELLADIDLGGGVVHGDDRRVGDTRRLSFLFSRAESNT